MNSGNSELEERARRRGALSKGLLKIAQEFPWRTVPASSALEPAMLEAWTVAAVRAGAEVFESMIVLEEAGLDRLVQLPAPLTARVVRKSVLPVEESGPGR